MKIFHILRCTRVFFSHPNISFTSLFSVRMCVQLWSELKWSEFTTFARDVMQKNIHLTWQYVILNCCTVNTQHRIRANYTFVARNHHWFTFIHNFSAFRSHSLRNSCNVPIAISKGSAIVAYWKLPIQLLLTVIFKYAFYTTFFAS